MALGSPASVARGWRALVTAAVLQMRAERSGALVLLTFVQPAAFLTVTILAARRGRGDVRTSDVALGAGVLAVWGATVWQAGWILRVEQWQGTLASIVSRPTGLATVLLGKALGATVRAVVAIAVTVVAVSAAFGDVVRIHAPVAFALGAVAVVASATILGIVVSCVFIVSRAATRISEALGYPIFILGGLLVPLAVLPGWVRPVSAGVSLRWGGEILRAAAAGSAQPARAWVGLVATTLAYAFAARLLFVRMTQKARREGTLDLY